MKNFRSHNGSALLIVLGMLSFMVISAVAFSAYMRTARLPSSYLRRTVSSRMLVKAALSEVMERLDFAINDNPYPGVGEKVCTGGSNRGQAMGLSSADITGKHNYFWHNIFIGTNGWLSAANTVSTLTLEGLAYLPPPLVNEARRYSRLTPTATWHWLNFDAGRYAYSVVDVSDCFDINRIPANYARNSGSGRLSLAYLFEDSQHRGYQKNPSDWDDFMDDYLEDGIVGENKVPLVSLADMNLALGPDSPTLPSLFCDYVKKNQTWICNNANSPARNMMFVTDSYFPDADSETEDMADLATPEGQPFSSFAANATIQTVMNRFGQNNADTDGGSLLAKKLCGIDGINLWDYLDTDNIPVSLGIPSVERAPMICGLTPKLSLQTSPSRQQLSSTKTQGFVEYEVGYRLGLVPAGLTASMLDTVVCFPFQRDSQTAPSFSADGLACLFFTEKTPGFRGFTASGFSHGNDSDFNGSGAYNDGIFRIPGTANNFPQFTDASTEEKAVRQFTIPLRNAQNFIQKLNTEPIFTVRYKVKLDEDGNEVGDPVYTAAHCNVVPVDTNGKPLADYSNDARFLEIIKNGSSPEFKLNLACWIRVKEGSNTVDMAPATTDDDKLNGRGTSLGPVGQKISGATGPALRFTTNLTLKYHVDEFVGKASTSETEVSPNAILCPDPRYNYAPENWMQASSVSPSSWLSTVKSILDSDSNRDRDIWMFCSNQGYMQSVYELAMLPRLANLTRSGDAILGNLRTPSTSGTEYADSIGGLAHGGLMWTTYRCFGSARDPFEDIGVYSSGASCKVNPYAKSANSIIAAFANTPYDWSVASTNNPVVADMEAKTFNRRYAFSAMNDKAKFAWDDLLDIAENFRDLAQEQALQGNTWEDAWDKLDWTGDNFCGAEMSGTDPLSSVDRKFLYGYWHDSFANRQQLFLIFVRAEPTMMGGGAVGQVPPALGARVVALVWRDPTVSTPGSPHRMRVLFYRQFE